MPLFRRRSEETVRLATEPASENYEGKLAYIGRRLDEEACRTVVILEVSGNFIVKAIDKATDELNVTEFVSEDFERGDVRLPFEPHPSSYELMLRAIGKELDARVAMHVAVIEGPTTFQVVGWERGHAGGAITHVRFDTHYDRPTLQRLASARR